MKFLFLLPSGLRGTSRRPIIIAAVVVVVVVVTIVLVSNCFINCCIGKLNDSAIRICTVNIIPGRIFVFSIMRSLFSTILKCISTGFS